VLVAGSVATEPRTFSSGAPRALLWANSPWAHAYATLLHAPLGVRIGAFALERDVEWFVNDGLMAVFFFVVGLEIRRELHHGELPVDQTVGGRHRSIVHSRFAIESTRGIWFPDFSALGEFSTR
jgi:hypothetical protein